MEKSEIFDRLSKRMADIFEIDIEEIQLGTKLVADLDTDSIDLLQLMLGLKDDFGISVSDGEVKELLSELARFLPADYSGEELTDAQLAAVTEALTVSTLVDFVSDRSGGAP